MKSGCWLCSVVKGFVHVHVHVQALGWWTWWSALMLWWSHPHACASTASITSPSRSLPTSLLGMLVSMLLDPQSIRLIEVTLPAAACAIEARDANRLMGAIFDKCAHLQRAGGLHGQAVQGPRACLSLECVKPSWFSLSEAYDLAKNELITKFRTLVAVTYSYHSAV